MVNYDARFCEFSPKMKISCVQCNFTKAHIVVCYNKTKTLMIGQPSDSSGGTFKRWVKNVSMAGDCKDILVLFQIVDLFIFSKRD